jgi:hypothetical protein
VKIRIALRRVLLVFPVALLASACTVRMMNGSSVAQDPQIAFFGKPVVGEFLCLSSMPNEPIYSRPGPDAGNLDYTRNVVAFAGMQQGGQIMIITYSGLDGWIDGTKIAPFHGAPGQRCIVPGRDLAQRPIFEID